MCLTEKTGCHGVEPDIPKKDTSVWYAAAGCGTRTVGTSPIRPMSNSPSHRYWNGLSEWNPTAENTHMPTLPIQLYLYYNLLGEICKRNLFRLQDSVICAEISPENAPFYVKYPVGHGTAKNTSPPRVPISSTLPRMLSLAPLGRSAPPKGGTGSATLSEGSMADSVRTMPMWGWKWSVVGAGFGVVGIIVQI